MLYINYKKLIVQMQYAVSILAILLFLCTTAKPLYAQNKAQSGIVQGSIGEASNLIPYLGSDSASSAITRLLYIAPLRYDKNLNIITYAAEWYRVEDEGKRITIRLRSGLLWEDGKEVTAEDVEFTYKFMIDPNTPTAYAENYLNIKKFTVLDRYTFQATYEHPFARSLITWMGDILPKHALEGQDPRSTPLIKKPLTSGPYRLQHWNPGSSITLQANPDYFEGAPGIEQIIFRVIPDQTTMFLELRAGKLDMSNLTPLQYERQTSGAQWEQNYNKFEYLDFSYAYLGYNLKNPLFTEKKVRQALSYAINKQDIIKGALLGKGVATIGPYKPETWAYNTHIQAYPYDPDKARLLLKEAGWADTDGDGILDKEAKPFSFTIVTNQGNEQRIKAAIIIQDNLKQIGIEAKVRTIEWASFINEFIHKGLFDATLLAWTITADPDAYDVWHSSKAIQGGLNFTYFINKEVDKLLEKGRSTLDQNERKIIYDRFQELLHEEQPYCFLYVPYSLPMVTKRIQGIEPAPAGILHNFIYWQLLPANTALQP